MVRVGPPPGPGQGRGPAEGRGPTEGGFGSGIVYDADGLVLTNAHVVGDRTDVAVTFPQGRRAAASVVGRDRLYDVALVRVPRELATRPAEWGDSDALRVGQVCIAIGNPFGLEWTVTMGVISATDRSIPLGRGLSLDGLLQTDTPINPGNSGGPLATLDGRVVGVTTAVLAAGQGLGFAIPAATARRVAAQLLEHGRAFHPWLGIAGVPEIIDERWVRLFDLPASRGLVVTDVVPSGPAARAGLRPLDMVVEVGGRPVTSAGDVRRELARLGPAARVRVRVLRGSRLLDLEVRVEELPQDLRAVR